METLTFYAAIIVVMAVVIIYLLDREKKTRKALKHLLEQDIENQLCRGITLPLLREALVITRTGYEDLELMKEQQKLIMSVGPTTTTDWSSLRIAMASLKAGKEEASTNSPNGSPSSSQENAGASSKDETKP